MGFSKKIKEETSENVERDDQAEEPGTTWENPGEFPEFRGNAEKKLTDEEKEERDHVVKLLSHEINQFRYVRMPKGREMPADEEFGDICEMLHDVSVSEDPDFITSTLNEIRSRLTVLEQKVWAEFDAEAQALRDRIAELRKRKAPEGKFQFPGEVFDEILSEIDHCDHNRDLDWVADILFGTKRQLDELERLMNELDQEVGEKLWALYSDPEISVGAHGTEGGRDTGFGGVDGPIMKHGIGCCYGDIRRTVSFQDRGRIHAHGDLTFMNLLLYSFGQKGKTTRELSIEDGNRFKTGEEVPSSQYTAIVAIPKGCHTDELDVLTTEERIPVIVKSRYTSHPEKMARAIKPKFIVGMVRDGELNEIVWNPRFNADEIRELSRKHAAIHAEEARVREEEERRKQEEYEAEQARKKEADSKKLSSRLKRLLSKLKKS